VTVYVPFASGVHVVAPVSLPVLESELVLVSEPVAASLPVALESSPLEDEHATAKTTADNEPKTKPK
jgi:hypothetical protein